jgi:hypothetical protein
MSNSASAEYPCTMASHFFKISFKEKTKLEKLGKISAHLVKIASRTTKN